MTEDELLKLYERMDAHEHDHRDKILGRLQLAFAVITALATVQTYIVLRADLSQVGASFLAVAFLVVFLMALALLIAAGYYFVRALWNHNYECPPYARDIEDYWKQLKAEAPGSIATAERWMGIVVRNYFIKCQSTNAAVNKQRADLLHLCTSWLVYALPATILAGLLFMASGIQTS